MTRGTTATGFTFMCLQASDAPHLDITSSQLHWTEVQINAGKSAFKAVT
jgi:hypothetical protein